MTNPFLDRRPSEWVEGPWLIPSKRSGIYLLGGVHSQVGCNGFADLTISTTRPNLLSAQRPLDRHSRVEQECNSGASRTIYALQHVMTSTQAVKNETQSGCRHKRPNPTYSPCADNSPYSGNPSPSGADNPYGVLLRP